jgi:hypothetical protein
MQPLLTAQAGIHLRFTFNTSKGQGTTTQVMPLICHIVMLYVHQATNFTTEQRSSAHHSHAKLWHVEWENIVSQPEVVTELLR